MIPSFHCGQQVTVVSRSVTGQDSYNNDVYSETTRVIDGCVIAPGNSSVDTQGTASVSSDASLHVPEGTRIGAFDAVILPDGKRYRVLGTPNSWQSPFTGAVPLTEIQLQIVTGAMEQFPSSKAGG